MRRIRVDATQPAYEFLRAAATTIHDGGIAAYPTDTFYGLGVDPRSAHAVRKLFALKGRTFDKAVPLIASDEQQVQDAGVMSGMAVHLARHFWPGPLTLIIAASPALCAEVHAGTGRVAVRVPDHPVARELAKAVGHPITATSANPAGAPPASTADQVAAILGDAVDVVIDAGSTPGEMPSTIVDVTGSTPTLVRPGRIPWDHVLEFLK